MTQRSSAPRVRGAALLAVVLVANPGAEAQTAAPVTSGPTAAPVPPSGSTNLGEITVEAAPAANAPPQPGTAAYDTPSRAPLDATQPTSVVGQRFIQRNVVPTNNYDDIIKYSPSVQNIEPVGAGLQQNFLETIRGFTYRQFNTTFDGIVVPGTVSTFAPQTAAYFMAHDIGSVEVDRGPGTASTIGYATFGGTVSIRSKPPADTFTVEPYTTFGSYNVFLRGLQVDSGAPSALGGARGFLDLQALDADGYLTGTQTRRRNGFIKFEVPVGANTTMTFASNVDNAYTHTPIGATQQQINLYGPNYALNDNTRSQAFKGYNTDNYNTDFEYVTIKSDLGNGLKLEETPYTASYFHHGIVGLDPNGTTANLTGKYYVNGVASTLNNDVPGRAVHSNFRDYGNILRLTGDTQYGQARVGLWVDYNAANAYRTEIVLTDLDQPYAKTATGTPYDYLYKTGLTTYQPYVEFAAKPLPGLTITPGVKYTATTRDLNAQINQSTKVAADFSETYSAVQPSVDARYTITPNLSAYAQIAKGFLAPPLSALQTLTPQNLNPQQTWNYQTGATWQIPQVTLAGDLYYIDFSNRITSQNTSNGVLYFNGGGAVYQGIELEGTVRLGHGLSMYANGTINQTYYKQAPHPRLADAPEQTAAIGPLYDKDGLSFALLAKYIGLQYGQDSTTVNGVTQLVDSVPIKAYASVDFAAAYTLPILNGRHLDFKLNVYNIFDNHSLIGFSQFAGDGITPLYWTNPGRSVFLTVAASL